jgi:hypothetical protein
MRQVFRSKFGWELFLPIYLLLILVTSLITYDIPPSIERRFAKAILVGLQVFILFPFFSTSYHLDGSVLRVHCGVIYRKNFDIRQVKKVEKTNSWISAPAPSLDRILLTFQDGTELVLSPKDQAGFIAALEEVNGSILRMS